MALVPGPVHSVCCKWKHATGAGGDGATGAVFGTG